MERVDLSQNSLVKISIVLGSCGLNADMSSFHLCYISLNKSYELKLDFNY